MRNILGRRSFMKRTALAAGWITCAAAKPEQPPARPDILLIMPDQMRGDCLSILGHPAVQTPQFDKLAHEGTLFRSAYTPTASCIPARYAMLTGLHPQTSGVVGYDHKTISTPTLPAVLANSGYKTVLVGRNMHQNQASGNLGYQQRILGSTYISNDQYDQFLREAAPQSGGINEIVQKNGLSYNLWPTKPWPFANNLHPTEWVADQSRKVVEKADAVQPLFLTSSFYAPHPPLFPPKKYFDTNLRNELPQPAHGDWVNWGALSKDGNKNGTRILLEGERLRKAQAGYFGLIEHIDNQMESVISAFKARSERAGRPWVIILTSDHGEMLGDHGYFRKCEPYQGSANIPFIFSASPELGFATGQQVDQPVSLVDMMPTLLSLAGAQGPAVMDGANLVPTLKGQGTTIRKWIHFEHATCYSQSQAFQALTDGRFKYIWRPHNGREQLFDLKRDPHEEHDLAADPVSKTDLEQWRNMLIKRLEGRPEGFSHNGKLITGRKYRALNRGTLT